ncbi:diguanylate cyclase [Aliivibrio fischeri]|uniref:diguanylate cyclase n=1 Tax=Aliivibrio fischeri TaxID=668 RepID=UPI0012DA9F51|nr:diguanylate cyclase [Aliivibrio fischeri]
MIFSNVDKNNMYVKFFLCSFILSGYILYQYNRLEIESFKMEFQSNINRLYDTIRKITPYYLNTNTVELYKGTYTIDDVSVMVNENSKVKELSLGINLLETEIRKYIGDDYWSIAIIQKSDTNTDSNTAHFKPLREIHVNLNSEMKCNRNWIDRILINEKISSSYYVLSQCDLKLTEPYIENISDQKVRSIFYPIYVNKKLTAMFLLDMKETVFTSWLNKFNRDRFSFLYYLNEDNPFFVSNDSINIPCSPIGNVLGLSINMNKVIVWSFLFASVITGCFIFIEQTLRKFIFYCTLDDMTGLYRRDFYEMKLNHMSDKSIIIVDIDKFKNINDKYGHSKGDEVITEVCRRLRQCIRGDDLAIRWGGEEFVIVLSNVSSIDLFNRSEAIRVSVSESPIAGMNVSVSIGAAIGKKSSFKRTLKMADTALYQSKNAGRNKVTVFEG